MLPGGGRSRSGNTAAKNPDEHNLITFKSLQLEAKLDHTTPLYLELLWRKRRCVCMCVCVCVCVLLTKPHDDHHRPWAETGRVWERENNKTLNV